MIIIRLLPIILSALLIAAHLLRFYGWIPTIITLSLLITLFIREKWPIRLWQGIMAVAVLMWLHTSFILIQVRIEMGFAWTRLLFIMASVIAFTLFSLFWLNNKNIKSFYTK